MKWLLVSNTQNWNPGDEWIRAGVVRLISEVDPKANYVVLNKEIPEHSASTVEYDRAVWCGSPLFWSHAEQNCWDNAWWKAWIEGWLFKNPERLLILGAGDAVGEKVADPEGYAKAIETVRSRCWKLVTRNKVCDDSRIEVSVCPSVFALAGNETPRDLLLCNLMPEGAHDAVLNPEQAKFWREQVKEYSEFFIAEGFHLVSHAGFENDFSQTLNWPKDRLFLKPKTAEEYYPIYRRCKAYVGNRLHGAMLAISAGAPAMAIGYDSRLKMVSEAGGTIYSPAEVNAKTIRKWLAQSHEAYDWKTEFERQKKWLRQFAGL